mgnify:CR=1 FL=1
MTTTDIPHPAELCIRRTRTDAEEAARREPVEALAAALRAGLLLKALPAPTMARPVAVPASPLPPSVWQGPDW